MALLPQDQRDHFRALWDEFEARTTPEARFAKAMDRLQALRRKTYSPASP
ncbi:HD domain-containing protein [Streptomyces sp. NPDC002671]